jgi:hypothetical protein
MVKLKALNWHNKDNDNAKVYFPQHPEYWFAISRTRQRVLG